MNHKRQRKLRAKTKFLDGKTFIHPHISYKLSDRRRRYINRVNDFVRRGYTYKEIGTFMNMTPTTVRNYYYGMANNCLSPKQLEELKLLPGSTIDSTKIVTRLAADGESPTRINVRQPIITSTTIHYFDEDELTASMPLPFEIRTTKFIPSSIGCDFGNCEHESFEYVDVVDLEITKSVLKSYCVIYRGACCNI